MVFDLAALQWRMPFLEVQTNVAVPPADAEDFLKAASASVAAELGKPEAVMMTSFCGSRTMTFGGTTDPLAMVDLALLGFDPEKAPAVVEILTDLTASKLRIAPERVFVKFTEVPRGQWAGNGTLF